MSEASISVDEYQSSMQTFMAEGTRRAHQLGNRGPIRFDDKGKLTPDILESYWRHGFYVFTGLVSAEEIDRLRTDYAEILDRAPVDNKSDLDAHGRTALGTGMARRPFSLIEP